MHFLHFYRHGIKASRATGTTAQVAAADLTVAPGEVGPRQTNEAVLNAKTGMTAALLTGIVVHLAVEAAAGVEEVVVEEEAIEITMVVLHRHPVIIMTIMVLETVIGLRYVMDQAMIHTNTVAIVDLLTMTLNHGIETHEVHHETTTVAAVESGKENDLIINTVTAQDHLHLSVGRGYRVVNG